MLCAKVFPQAGLDRVEHSVDVGRSQKTCCQRVNLVGQPLIGACHIEQILEFALELVVLLSQRHHLAFHQRYRRATGLVRQPQ